MDREAIRKRQKFFRDTVNEKLEDYLMTEPDEDEVICELYFRKGEEEQRKSLRYVRPGSDADNSPIRSESAAEILRKGICWNCNTWLAYLTEDTLSRAEFIYCPFCGSNLKEDKNAK